MPAKDDILFMQAEKKREAFRLASEAGSVNKYLVGVGWERNLMCFIIYGQSGGSNKAKEETDAIGEAIREEIAEKTEMPIIIKGDFNMTPKDLSTMKELIEEDACIDVGNVASWCGGTDNEPKCKTRPGANLPE